MIPHEDDDPTTPEEEARAADAAISDEHYREFEQREQDILALTGELREAEDSIRRWHELAAVRLQRIEELEKALLKSQRYAQRLLDSHPDHMPLPRRVTRPVYEDPEDHAIRMDEL